MYWNTPWGKPDGSERMIPGITYYSGQGHGGVHLSKKRIAQLPLCIKPEHSIVRDLRWWEEDSDIYVIYAIFAKELYAAGAINELHIQRAIDGLQFYKPELFEELYVSLKLNDAYDIILA